MTAARAPEPLDEDLLILGEGAAIQRVRDLIGRVAPTGAAVLVRGEAGVGKSLVARNLHARSGRTGAFVRVDVRGLGGEGGISRAAAEALGGTLFLDEVAELSPSAQAEVLAVLDARLDVRLVSASRARPEGLRDGLLDQLATVEIALPLLAERDDDTVLLAQHFVRLFSRRYGRDPKPLEEAATAFLRIQPPPGEVRGLRQAAERAVVLGAGPALTAADFAPSALAEGAAPGQLDLNLARSERAIVEAALKRHAHNVSHAAKELGLTRAALYRRMVKHGL
jgi:DNA-binding NtrC family response regulator